MLIWINGAFGAGKTQTAHELLRRLPDAHVSDPERLGYALHKMLPAAQRSDFQDLPQWRAGVVATLQQADAGATRRTDRDAGHRADRPVRRGIVR